VLKEIKGEMPGHDAQRPVLGVKKHPLEDQAKAYDRSWEWLVIGDMEVQQEDFTGKNKPQVYTVSTVHAVYCSLCTVYCLLALEQRVMFIVRIDFFKLWHTVQTGKAY
jgi:hypothetical protein